MFSKLKHFLHKFGGRIILTVIGFAVFVSVYLFSPSLIRRLGPRISIVGGLAVLLIIIFYSIFFKGLGIVRTINGALERLLIKLGTKAS